MTENQELVVKVEATVAANNFPEFAAIFRAKLAEINRDPSTDEEFSQASDDVKALKAAENAIKDASAAAIAQAEEINALFSSMAELSDEARTARLSLEKVVEGRKEAIRKAAITLGLDSIRIDKGTAVKHYLERLRNAAKGKRTVKSLEDAVEKETILINSELSEADQCIGDYEDAHGAAFVADSAALRLLTVAEIQATLNARVEKLRLVEEKKGITEALNVANQAAADLKEFREEALKPPKPAETSAADEFAEITEMLRTAFADIKISLANLEHAENKVKFEAFRDALNQAWRKLTS